MIGVKIDIKKCFDSASQGQALKVMRRMGCDCGVLGVLHLYDECADETDTGTAAGLFSSATDALQLHGCPSGGQRGNSLATRRTA